MMRRFRLEMLLGNYINLKELLLRSANCTWLMIHLAFTKSKNNWCESHIHYRLKYNKKEYLMFRRAVVADVPELWETDRATTLEEESHSQHTNG